MRGDDPPHDRLEARRVRNLRQPFGGDDVAAAARPLSYIFANTSFATVELMVPFSTIAISPASAAGVIGTASMSMARSFMLRSTSPITQLLAALGLPDCCAVSSK